MARKRNQTKPYGRRTWRGVTLENRSISALEWVEKRWTAGVGKGKRLVPVQGSFSTSVRQSGQTHAGGGSVDLSVAGLSRKQRRRLVRIMRRAGWASYYRPPMAGVWGPHIHAILLGNKTASAAAKWQMSEYRAGRDALTGGSPDRAWRPHRIPRWSHKRNRPIT